MGIIISLLFIATAIPIAKSLIETPSNTTVSRFILSSDEVSVVTSEKLNEPPLLGNPYPSNNSLNNPLSFIFSIIISDLEGDLFDWTIQCSNGQSSSGTGQSNGTKLCVIDELEYSTSYRVWVNATDPAGSGLYRREWFNFTTKASLGPVFGIPSPANGSINTALGFNWNISISDPEGDRLWWTIECSNGQTASGSNETNGTKTLVLSGLAYETLYKVWVNATDPNGSAISRRRWFVFTTVANQPPVFGSPSPSNGSSHNPLIINWSIPINDSEGDLFNWTIQCSNAQATSDAYDINGTKLLVLSGLTNLTTYKVWVNATDSGGSNLTARRWYVFTTEGNDPPVFGSPTPSNGSINISLDFTWSILISDPEGYPISWTIQCSNGQNASGSLETNGTKSLVLSGLAYSTVYTVWVNATDPTGGGFFTREWYTFRTLGSQPPETPMIFGPTNGEAHVSYSYNFVAVDPDGDDVYYRIDWGDGSAITQWIGPYHSGELLILPHTFSRVGISVVRCQAKDTNDELSDWGNLEVTMPIEIHSPFQLLLEKFFERFPHVFPLLRYILGY